jgi:hypothetical protein
MTTNETTTGTTGSSWRATIRECGSIHPWEGEALNWFVAADDRWHVPSEEAAARQIRIEGTPVTETRLRVPTGDVVQRIFSVAGFGGLTVVEVENESTMPVAVAFDRRDVLTDRLIADVPIEGIELPPDSFVLPLGHKAVTRVAIGHSGPSAGPLPSSLPTVARVVNGWLVLSRMLLPDGLGGAAAAEAATAARCELALGVIPHAGDSPAAFAVALGELVRMNEDPEPWLPELAGAVESLAPATGWPADVGLQSARRVLVAADEPRATRDIDRIVAARASAIPPDKVPADLLVIPWIEQRCASGGALFPTGIPADWLGLPVETYDLPTIGDSAVSFAVRWHGARPAVLWEQHGSPIELTAPVAAPGWRSSEPKGEVLWPEPPKQSSPSFS